MIQRVLQFQCRRHFATGSKTAATTNIDVSQKEGSLNGKTIFLTGGSRGIGLCIAKRAAQDGANIVIAAKTAEPHPKLPGTIYSAAEEIKAFGGQVLPLVCDIREEDQVEAAVKQAVATFGGIDILINNASVIQLAPTEKTTMASYDLMQNANARGAFLTSQKCLPHLRQSSNPHILNLAPPLNMETRWFKNHLAYSISKYGMSMCVLGMAGEYKSKNIAVNALWPITTISTSSVANLPSGAALMKKSRTGDIMADAAYEIVTTKSKTCTGNFFLDEHVLRAVGVTDFAKYKYDSTTPESKLWPDFFV